MHKSNNWNVITLHFFIDNYLVNKLSKCFNIQFFLLWLTKKQLYQFVLHAKMIKKVF